LKDTTEIPKYKFDKTNALIGALVFLFCFVIYRLTVQPTLSYWDCGEFIACAYILGIPHPPGSPVFIVLGRIFSILPFVSDICLRINMISVISSAVAVLFGYLSVVRMITYWYVGSDFAGWKRVITYIGGVVGSLFMAFSATYWANAVEAEVYGLSMTVMTIILWLILIYYERRGTAQARRILILVCYLAMLGVGIHLTTFLILPVAAIIFVLKKNAPEKAYLILSSFFIVELLAIIVFSNNRGGFSLFIFASIIFMLITAFLTYRYINWPVLIGTGAFSLVIVGFFQFVYALIGGAVLMIILASAARNTDWKMGLTVMLIAVVGYSFHLFIPIRSAQQPRINENNPSRDFSLAPWSFLQGKNDAFVGYLDRKQYGSQLMVERSFQRRGKWSNQFGRHPHMGFWSYFEEQYGLTSIFLLVFILGLYGVYFMAIRKKQIGSLFLIILLMGTAGLVLYMNFADGTKYNPQTGDAYLEVRNRDYFFTPGFSYFGLALGLGAAGLMEWVRRKTSVGKFAVYQKPALAIMCILVLLPGFALAGNYFESDRSDNYYPKIYSENLLNTCEENAILFTSGDNDTFPIWCVQEVYGHRKDIRVVNLSLFNTYWYVAQMKNQYDVPISLTDEQILWNKYEVNDRDIRRPAEPFYDRPRKRRTYLVPMPHEGRVVKLQDMMVDEVVLENKWRNPIYFSSEPYAESPLKLRDIAAATGILYKLDTASRERPINGEEGYRLYTEVYKYDGLNDPNIYRDENATGVMLTLGFNVIRIADEFRKTGQMDRALEFLEFILDKYPEFYLGYQTLAEFLRQVDDSAGADSVLLSAEETLSMLLEKSPQNLFYMADLGMAKYHLGKVEEGAGLLWKAFEANPNDANAYRKLMQLLWETRRAGDLLRATKMHAEYKVHLTDPLVQQVLGSAQKMSTPPPVGP
jgi:hypothetical protein